MCTCMLPCVTVPMTQCMWNSQRLRKKSIFSSHHEGHGDWIQVHKGSNKYLHLLSQTLCIYFLSPCSSPFSCFRLLSCYIVMPNLCGMAADKHQYRVRK